MKAPMTDTVAKLLRTPTTARKLSTAIRQAKFEGQNRVTVVLDEQEQRSIGLADALTCPPARTR